MTNSIITSESNGQIKELIKLQKQARERRKTKKFVAEGITGRRSCAESSDLLQREECEEVSARRAKRLIRFLRSV